LNTPGRSHLLAAEWQAIVNRATSDARIIWRSGGLDGHFVDSIRVKVNGATRRVGELLGYFPEHAAALHARDRVHTYGCFCIADLDTR
jgi:S-adenosylmethionine-diacylglycerol 3-amino-3-carboxypropyl transferase